MRRKGVVAFCLPPHTTQPLYCCLEDVVAGQMPQVAPKEPCYDRVVINELSFQETVIIPCNGFKKTGFFPKAIQPTNVTMKLVRILVFFGTHRKCPYKRGVLISGVK